MIEPAHLIHIPVALNELARFAHTRDRGTITRRRKADGREVEAGFDEGRALHHLLDETFGPGSLRPFRLMVAPRKVQGAIYAYSRYDKRALLATAGETAPPEAARVLALDTISERKMPSTWAPGRRLGFDIRVRAVVRVKAGLPDPRKPGTSYKEGAELDAFFVEAQRTQPDGRPRIVDGKPSAMATAERTREAVYRDWLAARIGSAATIDPAATTLQCFERSRVARLGCAPEGPDATFHGELEIGDPEAFVRLLANGIGRHKAYGYGMLMLRPARKPAQEF